MSTFTDPGATAVWPPPPEPDGPTRTGPSARELVTRALPARARARVGGGFVGP